MTKLISIDGVEIIQKNFQQVLIRGDGKEKFNQIINKEISILPPSKNLEIARKDSLNIIEKINWEDGFCRKEIGGRVIKKK